MIGFSHTRTHTHTHTHKHTHAYAYTYIHTHTHTHIHIHIHIQRHTHTNTHTHTHVYITNYYTITQTSDHIYFMNHFILQNIPSGRFSQMLSFLWKISTPNFLQTPGDVDLRCTHTCICALAVRRCWFNPHTQHDLHRIHAAPCFE